VVVQDVLHRGIRVDQALVKCCHFVNNQVGPFRCRNHVFIKSRVTGNDDTPAGVVDAIPVRRLDDFAVVDFERGDCHAVRLEDDTVGRKFSYLKTGGLGRALFIHNADRDIRRVGLFQPRGNPAQSGYVAAQFNSP
jgi:hypothetical protein